MEVNVLVFGQLAEKINASSIAVADVTDTDTLLQKLKADFPLLVASKFVVAVNKKMIKENTTLVDGTIVALLPPFSGG